MHYCVAGLCEPSCHSACPCGKQDIANSMLYLASELGRCVNVSPLAHACAAILLAAACSDMPRHAMPCLAVPCPAMSHVMLHNAILKCACHSMPCHAMPCHAMPCHAMPCPWQPAHVMACVPPAASAPCCPCHACCRSVMHAAMLPMPCSHRYTPSCAALHDMACDHPCS